VEQDLPPVVGGTEHRFAGHPGVQSLGHAVDEEVGDLERERLGSLSTRVQ
jgi:hypothetical protein